MKSQTLAKARKLSLMYDISNFVDLLTLIPQEMEIAEAKGLAYNLDGKDKKKLVVDTLLKIAKESSVELDSELLSVFIDTINLASKGKYALNKQVKNEK